MRVVLIAPAPASYIWRKKRAAFTLPPMALPLLAAVTPPGVEVRLIDEAVQDVDLNLEADLVGLSVMTATAPRAYQLADHFRSRGIKVVMGGVHPSSLPEEALRHSDSVVIGEGEGQWVRVLEDAGRGTLERTYQDSASIDLETLPAPRWDLLPSGRYFVPRTVQVTRGCPMACSFCTVSSFFGRSYRLRPVSQVIDEIKAHEKRLLIFADDNIAGHPDSAKELFAAMIPLKKKWCCHPIEDDPEVLDLAARAGAWYVYQAIFDTSDYIRERIRRYHDHGIGVEGTILLGLDHHTEDYILKLIDFLLEVELDIAEFTILTPFPHTQAFDDFHREGRILSFDWNDYTCDRVVFQPRHLSPERLQELYYHAWESFYRHEPQNYKMFKLIKKVIEREKADNTFRHRRRDLMNRTFGK